MNPDRIRGSKAFNSRWYYRLELAPGLFTPGRNHRAVAETRALLRCVDIESGGGNGGGARCLDVGIQEAMVMLLLHRRGASEVVGYDRALRKSRLMLVQRALGIDLDLVGGMRLQDLPKTLAEQGRNAFDVVVFSGVLYHMFDPIGGLAVIRGMVRNGGICLVETAAAFDSSDAMHFNRAGRFTPAGLWFITPRLLEYLLRFLRFEPLDVVHLGGRAASEDKPGQGRLAVACRAVDEPIAAPEDEWIRGKKTHDFAEFLDWNAVSSEAAEVGYDRSREGLVRRVDGTLDIQRTIEMTNPISVGAEETRLPLDARY